MKIVLVVLIFCVCLNLISAFSWFNFRWNQQPKQINSSPSTHRQGSTRQQNHGRDITSAQLQTSIVSKKNDANRFNPRKVVNWGQYAFHNSILAHRQADGNINKSTPMIRQNRPRGFAYEQQRRYYNNPVVARQNSHAIKNTNNSVLHPRFRPFLSNHKNNIIVTTVARRRILHEASLSKSTAVSKAKNSSIFKNNIQPFRSAVTKATGNNGIGNRRNSFADFYYRQKLRAFYQRKNEKNTAQTHSTIKTPLQQRKRQFDQKDEHPETFNSMIFARKEPSNGRNLN